MKLLGLSIFFLTWAFMARCVLLLGSLELSDYQHYLCGPWGCGPSASALLAAHGFWVVNFLAGLTLLAVLAPPRLTNRCGLLLTVAGLCGLLALGTWDLSVWLPRVAGHEEKYLAQRYLFTLATSVDLPIVETTLAGLVALALGRRSKKHCQSEEVSLLQRTEASTLGN